MKSATDKNGAFSPDDVNIYRQMPGVSAEERLVRDEAAWNALVDTAFGKTVSETDDRPSLRWFRQRANRGDVLYINKNKSIAWLRANGNSSPAESANSNALSKFIVSGVGQNVKTEVDLDAAKKTNPEVIGILKLVRWDELNEEEQERYRKQQEASDEKEEEADEVSTEQNTGVQFTYDGKEAGDLSADVFEGIELLDGGNSVHDTESLREKYDDLLAHAERIVERDKKHLANVNKAISILYWRVHQTQRRRNSKKSLAPIVTS